MGFSLKRAIRGSTRRLVAAGRQTLAIPGVGQMLGIPPAISAGLTQFYRAGRTSPAGAGVPALAQQFGSGFQMTDTGMPVGASGGEMIPVMAGSVLRFTEPLMNAIGKLAAALGVRITPTAAGLSAAGGRIWASLQAFGARHPTLSMVAMMTAIGLTTEEAMHFLAWGATKKKRRRRGGISMRDMRTTRRTVRKVIRMHDMLRHLCAGGHFRGRGRALPRAGTQTFVTR